jgi:signal transduction histidine kinase
MNCLTSLELTFASVTIAALWMACALVLARILQNKHFSGKSAFVLTFVAMLWWLFTVGFDLTSRGFDCKVGWSLAAWPGIALLPIAWAFFVFDYTMNAEERPRPARMALYIAVPAAASLIALTNSQTQLLYGAGTHLISDDPDSLVYFDHGPLFYMIALGLYVFVFGTLAVLTYAFMKAKRSILPFLIVLYVITALPLSANIAYVGWEFTVFGFDPTPFMFAVALIAFSWLLLNNALMDTEALGRNLLFYAITDPVIIIDNWGRFAAANGAAETVLGGTLPRQGETLDHLEQLSSVLKYFQQTGKTHYPEPFRIGKRIFEARALPIKGPIEIKHNLLGWSVSLADITERERTAEQLRQAVAEAEEASHAKSQFLAMISHELRTPMTSVKGGLDLALHGIAGEISDPVKNLLSIAQRNSIRILKLVDDVLDLQKLDLNAITIDLQDLNPDQFLREIVEEHTAYAAEAQVQLTITSADIGRLVRADPIRLKQVIGNVISNAVKFSPKGGVVGCSAALFDTTLRLAIHDNGMGIPEGQQDQVFGRFNQVQTSTTSAPGGSGLGMHIAKLLIERMGGRISYISGRDKIGTTFYIEIPLSQNAQSSAVRVGQDDPSLKADAVLD